MAEPKPRGEDFQTDHKRREPSPKTLTEKTARQFYIHGLYLVTHYGAPVFKDLEIPRSVIFRLDPTQRLLIELREDLSLSLSFIEPSSVDKAKESTAKQELWTIYDYHPNTPLDKRIKKILRIEEALEFTEEGIAKRKKVLEDYTRELEAEKLELRLESVDEADFLERLDRHYAQKLDSSMLDHPERWREWEELESADMEKDKAELTKFDDEEKLLEINKILVSIDPKAQLIHPKYEPPEEISPLPNNAGPEERVRYIEMLIEKKGLVKVILGFERNFPKSDTGAMLPADNNRAIIELSGAMDKTPEEIGYSLERYSEFRLSQTYREFFETIDRKLEELNISKEKVSSLRSEIEYENDAERKKLLTNRLFGILKPLFVGLVRDGYFPDDLLYSQ